MRYLMLSVLAFSLVAPLVGCESHEKESTTHNPITGSTTTTKDNSVTGN
jgi:hypothetical protein